MSSTQNSEHNAVNQNQFSSPVIVEQQQDEIVKPSESAYSYHNLVLNPFGRKLIFKKINYRLN
jgi:hypothetical protein